MRRDSLTKATDEIGITWLSIKVIKLNKGKKNCKNKETRALSLPAFCQAKVKAT
jgi:hypothetical protein